MPAYTFEALDDAGKSRTGVLEAENAKAARSQLRSQGLVPLSVAALAASVQSAGASRWGRRVFNSTGLSVWTRQLAGLVGAGLPLERALTALADEADQPAPARPGGAPAGRGQWRVAVCPGAGQRAA